MTIISSDLRTAIVSAGAPISQRKRFGAANQTRPSFESGRARLLRLRVCITSAVHVWILVWALSQESTSRVLSAAQIGTALANHSRHPKFKIQTLKFTEAIWVQNETTV